MRKKKKNYLGSKRGKCFLAYLATCYGNWTVV